VPRRAKKGWREKSERKLRHSQIPLLIQYGKKDASFAPLKEVNRKIEEVDLKYFLIYQQELDTSDVSCQG